MAGSTPKLIKELREKSGAGMLDCKKALNECDGNIEEAMKFLRESGLAKAAKKAAAPAEEEVEASVDTEEAPVEEATEEKA